MADSLTATPPQRVGHGWPLAVGVALLLVLPIMLLGLLWAQRQAQPRVRGPIEPNLLLLPDATQVSPYQALLVLAEYPSEQVWQEAFRKREWDSALATWLFGPVRSDRESLETLVAFADAAVSTGKARQAAACLVAAADLARLTPELTDRERADLLVELGDKLSTIGLEGAAVTEWRQASILAHYSPTLPAMYRATLLEDLAGYYRRVGADDLAARAQEHAVQVGNAIPMLAVPERIVLDTQVLPPEPAELVAARERRRIAAESAALALRAGNAEPAYAELRDALSAEGILHRTWIADALQAGYAREEQAALLLYHINWLQRERMLAWGYAGPNFPTWAERRAQLEASLNEAWTTLELVRLDQSILEGVQERATLAQRDWWATRLAQQRLGRDPLLDVESLVASMQPNNADAAGEAMLRLDRIQGRFWRVPREFVGTNRLPE